MKSLVFFDFSIFRFFDFSIFSKNYQLWRNFSIKIFASFPLIFLKKWSSFIWKRWNFRLLRGRNWRDKFDRRFLCAPITLGSENSFSRTLSVWAASWITFLKFVDVCRAELHESHISKKCPAHLLGSQKTLEMNESRSHDGFFSKDRSKKFVFKKKLDVFEQQSKRI